MVIELEGEELRGRVCLRGTKTKARRRTVEIAGVVCRRLEPFLTGRTSHQKVFGGVTPYQVQWRESVLGADGAEKIAQRLGLTG